jgi:hypothetical protein
MDAWPFDDPLNIATITLRQIIHGGEPVLLVTHDADDGGWQSLTGGDLDVSEGMVVCLQHMVERDPSLPELADMPLGWRAWRDREEAAWQRCPEPTEDG